MALSSGMLLFPAAVGIAVIGALVSKAASFVSFHFLPSDISLARYRRQPRAWALVTGSSGGIGLGHIQYLAAQNFGVIILAHVPEEVTQAVALIRDEFPNVHVEGIVLNALTASYDEISSALTPFLNDTTRPITVLINNIALVTSSPFFTEFEALTSNQITSSVHINTTFSCHITRLLYPTLRQNSPSLILNTTSAAHILAPPWLAIYCASKSFNETFSRSLSWESEHLKHNIDILTIVPGDVRTPGNRHGCPPNAPTGREFAAMVLSKVGKAVSRGMKVYVPSWKHELAVIAMQWLPERWTVPAAIKDIWARKQVEEEAIGLRRKAE